MDTQLPGFTRIEEKPPIEVDAWFSKFHGSDRKDEDSHRGNPPNWYEGNEEVCFRYRLDAEEGH
jgi:hypothetical protein